MVLLRLHYLTSGLSCPCTKDKDEKGCL
uniref:Uncharacterized protein n=1 Tax=Anguilla anguilla TaxID=7936 RepID=A0A0E9TKP4_ANGAN